MSLPVWKNKWDTLCHKASPPPNPLTEGLTPARQRPGASLASTNDREPDLAYGNLG